MCIPSWAVDISPNSKVNLALRQLCRFWLVCYGPVITLPYFDHYLSQGSYAIDHLHTFLSTVLPREAFILLTASLRRMEGPIENHKPALPSGKIPTVPAIWGGLARA